MIGRQRELIPAACGSAGNDANRADARCLACILDAVSRLVRKLAEIDLVRMARAREHADVGPGAEHARFARAYQNDLNRRVLEPYAFDRIRKLDIDSQIVRIELELVALKERMLLVHVHQQSGNIAVHLKLPMPVLCGPGLEINARLSVAQFRLCFRHTSLSHAYFTAALPAHSPSDRLHDARAAG